MLVDALEEPPYVDSAFSKVWIGPDANILKNVNPHNELEIHGGVTYPDVASIHTPNVLTYRRELRSRGANWKCADAVTVDTYTAERYYTELYSVKPEE